MESREETGMPYADSGETKIWYGTSGLVGSGPLAQAALPAAVLVTPGKQASTDRRAASGYDLQVSDAVLVATCPANIG